MPDVDALDQGPPLEDFDSVFRVYETRKNGGRLIYYGEPLASKQRVLSTVWPLFKDRGYEVMLTQQTGEYLLVAEPSSTGIDGVPWTNILLAIATLISTLYAGARWYYVPSPLNNPIAAVAEAWPFAAAVLGVLAVHELGHYVMSRYHNVDATLPYFIPVPTIIGTMGAVIKIKGQIPNRKALFDIGIAGPFAGLVATIFVTIIGLWLPPIDVPQWVLNDPNTFQVQFGHPPLLRGIAILMGQPLGYDDPAKAVNPVVFGGWVGMFVTFLNLIPVGQLDGGHIVRSVLGDRHATVAALVPGLLFALAGYLYYVEQAGSAVGIWVLWGVITLFLSTVGAAQPIDDEDSLGARRKLFGTIVLLFGALCFTPIPIQIIA